MKLIELDSKLVVFSQKININFSRLTIFIIYFWFGILKVVNLSPADDLVVRLFNKTLYFLFPFNIFFIVFGIFECIIGISFLIKNLDRFAIAILFFHVFTTTLPLFLLPQVWNGFLVPAIEGQYIIKNLMLLALAVNIGSQINNKEK